MSRIHSFPPVADANTRIIILGSMPGKESLQAGQYYAHPRNSFWPIMERLTGTSLALPYQQRIQILQSAGIAVWDVLVSCERHSSMDADIEIASVDANDFQSFFRAHPGITHVYFNGSMAEKFYALQVQPRLSSPQLVYRRLPSTSPANASMTFAQN